MANETTPPHRGGKGGSEPAARIQERRRRVWELSVKGLTQGEIALQLGISQSAVSRILRRLLEEDRELLRRQRQLARAVGLVRLQKLYSDSIDGYERSKMPQTTRRRREARRNNVTVSDTTEVVVREREGDPRFLARASDAVNQINRLVEKKALDTRGATHQREMSELPKVDPKALDDDELRQLVTLMRKAAGCPTPDPYE